MSDYGNWDALEGIPRLEFIVVDGVVLRPGDRVVLRPKQRADAFDLLLAGRVATIEEFEQDFDERVYVAVTVDEDPGRDFGVERQPGHRFFYSVNEVEPLGPSDTIFDDRHVKPGGG